MKEQKKLLRSISMSSLPSRDTMKQLSCVDRAIRSGLRDCVENVLKNGNISLSEDYWIKQDYKRLLFPLSLFHCVYLMSSHSLSQSCWLCSRKISRSHYTMIKCFALYNLNCQHVFINNLQSQSQILQMIGGCVVTKHGSSLNSLCHAVNMKQTRVRHSDTKYNCSRIKKLRQNLCNQCVNQICLPQQCTRYNRQ